jgi:DNA-binding FadR family transcriptional regulator
VVIVRAGEEFRLNDGHGSGGRRAALVSRPGAAAETIGRRIVSGTWKPGSVLPSFDQLADEFSVSRLSVREAMRSLAAKGLVDSRPRRGTIVRPRSEWSRLDPEVLVWQIGEEPNAAFVRNLFEARRIIEPEAAALVATRATEDVLAAIGDAFATMDSTDAQSLESIQADVAFHQAILTGTGNDFIAAFAPAIGTWLSVAFGVQRAARPSPHEFVPQHRAIVEAIRRGDADGARTAFRFLLNRAENDAMGGIRVRGDSDERQGER